MPWKLFFVGVLLGSLAFQSFISHAEQPDALSVAFLPQFDGSPYAATDCGPASVAMAINYATGEHLKPLEVRQAIAKLPGGGYAANPSSGTAIGDLARIARAHGVEVFSGDGAGSVGWGPERIRKHLNDGHPVIVLVRLAYLPGYSPTSQLDHYVVLIGANATGYVYNDPGLSVGAKRTIGERQLQLAQRATSVPGQGIALAGPAKAAKAPAPAPAQSFTIKVEQGDTLSQIAERFSVPQKDLVVLNKLANVNHIEVGQVLTVPGDEPKPAETPKSAGAPKQPEAPKPAEAPKQPEPPKQTEAPNLSGSATPAPTQKPAATPTSTSKQAQVRSGLGTLGVGSPG